MRRDTQMFLYLGLLCLGLSIFSADKLTLLMGAITSILICVELEYHYPKMETNNSQHPEVITCKGEEKCSKSVKRLTEVVVGGIPTRNPPADIIKSWKK